MHLKGFICSSLLYDFRRGVINYPLLQNHSYNFQLQKKTQAHFYQSVHFISIRITDIFYKEFAAAIHRRAILYQCCAQQLVCCSNVFSCIHYVARGMAQKCLTSST